MTCFNTTIYFFGPDAQQCPQPTVSQPQQPTLDIPLPVEIKEESMSSPHIRSGSGGERGVDPVKIENVGGGVGRQAGGPPGQGYSKYQKSLPPRFQRQQQVRIYTSVKRLLLECLLQSKIIPTFSEGSYVICYKCCHSFIKMSDFFFVKHPGFYVFHFALNSF